MLNPHYQELLTAFVDGELTTRQRRHVARLLRRSGEARDLLRKLQQDARDLHLLPVRTATFDLSGPVLEAIIQRKIKPVRRPRIAVQQSAFPAWAGMAAAASVLLLVGLGSFLSYSHNPGRSGNTAANRPASPENNKAPAPPADSNLVRAPREKEEPEEAPIPDRGNEDSPRIENTRPHPEENKQKPKPVTPAPRLPSEPVLASGQNEGSSKFERVELALPVIFKLDDLDKTGPAGKLQAQLESASAFRIELPCKDASRAFDRIRTALIGRKIGLVIDPAAQSRLKMPQFRNDYAVFLENVTPQDLVGMLARAGRIDRTVPAGKKAPEVRFDGAVVVKEMGRQDRHELHNLLGIDATRVRTVAAVPSTSIDIRRPLAETTEARVAAALDGKGVPRPSAAGDNAAMVLALTAARIRTPELKRFLDTRKPARPGTVQVLLVLRNIGS